MATGVMFHSVGLRRYNWVSPQISEDVDVFRCKIESLHRVGYRSVQFSSPEFLSADAAPGVCLTFDDGYLDNWVHVFPILEKLGMQATIFVTTDFIDPRDVLRQRAAYEFRDDSSHHPAECCAGFLSWPEMKAMERSGLVEIQSHAKTHTRWFRGPRVVDYWRPGAATRPGGPVWMLWNHSPEWKPFYLSEAAEQERQIPYGTPIYECGKALETRRWHPEEPALEAELVETVRRGGGASFFTREGWRSVLNAVVEKVREGPGGRGRFETQEEFHHRVRSELAASKATLEEGLGHEVQALVWPGGGVTPDVVRIAREIGYRRFTLPRQLVGDPVVETDMFSRVSSGCRVWWGARDLGNVTGAEFLWHLGRSEGRRGDSMKLQVARLARKVAWLSGRRPD